MKPYIKVKLHSFSDLYNNTSKCGITGLSHQKEHYIRKATQLVQVQLNTFACLLRCY